MCINQNIAAVPVQSTFGMMIMISILLPGLVDVPFISQDIRRPVEVSYDWTQKCTDQTPNFVFAWMSLGYPPKV